MDKTNILERVRSPDDLKGLSREALHQLADEVRSRSIVAMLAWAMLYAAIANTAFAAIGWGAPGRSAGRARSAPTRRSMPAAPRQSR